MLEKMKPCVYFKEVRMPNGQWKCRCGRDGTIRNRCSERCPHFRPTIWWRLRFRKWRRLKK